MLRESIQSVLDDELTYVTLATVNLHSNESHEDPKNAKPKPCYVCLGTKRIFFFEKDLSGEWGNQLYLPYKSLVRVTCYAEDDCGIHLHFSEISSGKMKATGHDLPDIYLSECADRKSLLVQLQILRLDDYICREKQAPDVSQKPTSNAGPTLRIDSFDITKKVAPWITEIHEAKENLKTRRDVRPRLQQMTQEVYDQINLAKPANAVKMEDYVSPDHAGQYRLNGWKKRPPSPASATSGRDNSSAHLVITDARFNPKEYTRLQPDEAPEILWHCFGRNTFRTRRLSHFSSYFTGAADSKMPNGDSWLLEVWTSAPAEQTFTNDSGTDIRSFVNDFLSQLSCRLKELKLLGKLTSVGKGRNSSAYKADTAQWECWQLQARLWKALDDVEPSSAQPTQPWSSMPAMYSCRDVIIYAMRRSFIPPFFDKSQDFIVAMFSPKLCKAGQPINPVKLVKNLTQLRRVSENIVDSLEASRIPENDTVVVRAKAEALTLSRAEFRWLQKFVRVTPPGVEKFKHFARSVQQMLSAKFKDLKGVPPSVSWKMQVKDEELGTVTQKAVSFRQQNVLERHAQIIRDPTSGESSVPVTVHREMHSDNCLVRQLPEGTTRFMLKRISKEQSAQETFHAELDGNMLLEFTREEKRDTKEGGSKRLLDGLTTAFQGKAFHKTLPQKTLAKKRLYAFLAFCLDGYFSGFDVFTVMSNPTAMEPFSKSTRRRTDFLLESMLHLRKTSDIFRWKPLIDTVQNVSLMEDLDFNYEVMCRLLSSQYIRRTLYKETRNYRIFVQFLVRLLAYCVRSPVAERRTLRLQSAVSIELVDVSRDFSAPLQKSDSVAKTTLGNTQQRNQIILLALPKILEFLRRITSDSLRTYMIAALVNFSFKNSTVKRSIMESKAASEIVNFLRAPDEDLVRHTCRLLVNLTSDSDTSSHVNGHFCQVIYSYHATEYLLQLVEPSEYEPRYRPVSLVTEAMSVLTNLASERDSGHLRDAVVLGLGTEDVQIDTGSVTVHRVIRLLSVDLLLRRPSDYLSGEDAIPTELQVERLMSKVCDLLIKITYQHSMYKYQVGLLAIDPLLYILEPNEATKTGASGKQEQRLQRLKQLHPNVDWDRLMGVPGVNLTQKRTFNLLKKMLTLIHFLVFDQQNIALFDQRGLFKVLLQIRSNRKHYAGPESVISSLCDQISARARAPSS